MTQIIGSTCGIHAPQDHLFECSEIGAGWARIMVRGNIPLDRIKSAVEYLSSRGVRTILTMRYATEPLGRAGLPDDMPAWLERVSGFARALPSVQHWQVDNETWQWLGTREEYIEFLQRTGGAIKTVNPTAKIIPIAMAGGIPTANSNQAKAVDAILSAPTHWDIFDFHSYSDSPEDMSAIHDWLESEMARKGYEKDIWSLETAGPWLTYSSEEHAACVVKRLILGAEAGVGVSCWAGMLTVDGQDSRYNRLALIQNEQKMPAYWTYKLLTSKLRGATSIERFPWSNSNLLVYKVLRLNSPELYVAWSRGSTVNAWLPIGLTMATATPIITRPGQTTPEPQVYTPVRGRIRLAVNVPVFVEVT